ncbi:hypothetical protein ACN6LF_001055, partial [[Kitasatospora] papulosa]
RRIAAETTRRLAALNGQWMPASALAVLRVQPADLLCACILGRTDPSSPQQSAVIPGIPQEGNSV